MTFALYNEEFVKREEVAINMEDRGYQFGDGIYEVIGVYNNIAFKMEEHMDRLIESAKKVRLNIPYSKKELLNMLYALREKNNLEKGLIYIQITRGSAPRSHPFPPGNTSSVLTAYTIPSDRQDKKLYEEGVTALLTKDIRWLRCDIKTLNLLPNVLAKQEAMEQNAFEAILYRDNDTITEGSSTNVFAVKDGVVFTHPANNYILNGITRQTVIDICRSGNIKVMEIPYSVQFLLDADEIFISGTYIDIIPVKEIINEKTNNLKSPGKVTQELMERLESMTLKGEL